MGQRGDGQINTAGTQALEHGGVDHNKASQLLCQKRTGDTVKQKGPVSSAAAVTLTQARLTAATLIDQAVQCPQSPAPVLLARRVLAAGDADLVTRRVVPDRGERGQSGALVRSPPGSGPLKPTHPKRDTGLPPNNPTIQSHRTTQASGTRVMSPNRVEGLGNCNCMPSCVPTCCLPPR